jgi:hypothetical protein
MALLNARTGGPQAGMPGPAVEAMGGGWGRQDAGRGRGREDAAAFLQLGMRCMTEEPVDLVAAHKWFNLAAMQGDRVAVRLRREIAAEMSPSEIAAAQRAARDWQSR